MFVHHFAVCQGIVSGEEPVESELRHLRPLLLRPLPFKFLVVGLDMIDAIAEAEGISLSTIQFKALLGKAC
ncbi:hypothetical protein R1flu_010063 [Riccia fluitans]|uniref:Uncharacterized protein n=1 Tax=Riccia fluitans TaxID=41844 RepID=A0ABD1Z3Y2_9MARC